MADLAHLQQLLSTATYIVDQTTSALEHDKTTEIFRAAQDRQQQLLDAKKFVSDVIGTTAPAVSGVQVIVAGIAAVRPDTTNAPKILEEIREIIQHVDSLRAALGHGPLGLPTEPDDKTKPGSKEGDQRPEQPKQQQPVNPNRPPASAKLR